MSNLNSLIDWYPWGQEALNRAKQENKAIFLSISSNICNGCYLMQNKSFNKKDIAKILNDNFISILVDKDERPDIERYYQEVYQLMNGKVGGLPLNIFLTSETKPFYSTTYIPTIDKNGMMGFENLLSIIISKYKKDFDTLENEADEILSFLNKDSQKIQATKIDRSIITTLSLQIKTLFDSKNGGFGISSKFPHIATLDLMLDLYEINNNADMLEKVEFTLNKMTKGGFYDIDNGGFYRYSKDENWLIPSLEKTLYDNALLSELFLRTYKITKKNIYKEIGFKTIDFVIDSMSNNGLFYCASSNYDREILIDKRVIVADSSMMIKTLFYASEIDNKYLSIAIKSLENLVKLTIVNGVMYHSSYIQEKPQVKAFFDDYAYLGEALIQAYSTTKDDEYLKDSVQLLNSAIEKYYNGGQWIFDSSEFKTKADIFDVSYPSSVATMVLFILNISKMYDEVYSKFAFKTLEINSYKLMRQPISMPKLTKATLEYIIN